MWLLECSNSDEIWGADGMGKAEVILTSSSATGWQYIHPYMGYVNLWAKSMQFQSRGPLQCSLFHDTWMNLNNANQFIKCKILSCLHFWYCRILIRAKQLFQRSLPPPFPSYGRAFANPLLGTSAIMCSPTPNSGPLKYMNHRRKKWRTCRCLCLFISVYGSFGDIWENNLFSYVSVGAYIWMNGCVCRRWWAGGLCGQEHPVLV